MFRLARETLEQQVRLFRAKAALAPFTEKEASAYTKLFNSLLALEKAEQAQIESLRLDQLSQEELDALTPEARAVLGVDATTTPYTPNDSNG